MVAGVAVVCFNDYRSNGLSNFWFISTHLSNADKTIDIWLDGEQPIYFSRQSYRHFSQILLIAFLYSKNKKANIFIVIYSNDANQQSKCKH